MGPEKTEVRYTNGGGDDTKVTFISGSQKYGAGDQDKGDQLNDTKTTDINRKLILIPPYLQSKDCNVKYAL